MFPCLQEGTFPNPIKEEFPMKMRSFRKEDVKGKKVLLRVDFNVPLKDGKVTDTTRIEAHMKTLEALLGSGAKVALASHLGRPKGKRVPEMSLSLVAPEAEKLYGVPVVFCDECVGPKVKEAMASLPKGSVLVLENLRFHAEEQENDRTFAENLAAPFDVFVMDAFSASHRADASTNGITEFLPSFSGALIEREVNMLSAVSENPEKPFVIILGGAKVSDKIGVVENLMDKASAILIGGGMAFTFLKARGGSIGKSLFEAEKAGDAAARAILDRNMAYLAELVETAARSFDSSFRTVLGGGIITKNPTALNRLAALVPPACELYIPEHPAEYGALWEARGMLK